MCFPLEHLTIGKDILFTVVYFYVRTISGSLLKLISMIVYFLENRQCLLGGKMVYFIPGSVSEFYLFENE